MEDKKLGKKCGIYGIHNMINDQWYVGQSQDIEKRWNAHRWGLSHGIGESIHLLRAWRKYGEAAFEWIVLEECNIKALDKKEIEWINKKDSFRNGYNQTIGGGGVRGYQQSEETQEKRSAALAKAMKRPAYRCLRSGLSKRMWEKEEYREKVLKRRSLVMATPEYKEKISKTSKDRYRDPKYKNNYLMKIREYFDNPNNKEAVLLRNRKTASNENRNRKIGAAHSARFEKNPMLREKVSAEAKERWADASYKEKVRKAQKEAAQTKAIPVLQVETGRVFSSMEEAVTAVGGKNKAGICNCCQGKCLTACGFQWRYANETGEEWMARRRKYLSSLIPSKRSGHTPVAVACEETGVIYNSCKEAAVALGLDASSISKVCRGKAKTTKNYHFKYVDKNNEKK